MIYQSIYCVLDISNAKLRRVDDLCIIMAQCMCQGRCTTTLSCKNHLLYIDVLEIVMVTSFAIDAYLHMGLKVSLCFGTVCLSH